MQKVKILRDLFIAKSNMLYKKGKEIEVSDDLARRHVKSGYMEIITPLPDNQSKHGRSHEKK